MLHPHAWSESLGKFLLRSWNGARTFFRQDMMESKWGHRVLDQIFREGKFSAERSRSERRRPDR